MSAKSNQSATLIDPNQNNIAKAIAGKYKVSESGCWLWVRSITDRGYGKVWAGPRGDRKLWYAHRASWVAHNGDIPDGKNICHKCDVRNCVNPDHLFVGSQSENIKDMFAKGRENRKNQVRGEEVKISKLSSDQIPKIRELHRDGRSLASLAREYSVTPRSIKMVVKRETWNHI